jgi:hypothetical protein
MPNPAPLATIRPPAPPNELSELLAQRQAIIMSSDPFRDWSIRTWVRTIGADYPVSRAHAVEIDELTKRFLDFLHGTELLAEDPYALTTQSDQLEYESIIRPVTQTFRAQVTFRGRAQPLPDNDD